MANRRTQQGRIQALTAMLAVWIVVAPLASDAHGQAQTPTLRPLGIGAPGVLGRQGNRDASTFGGAVSADGRRMVFATRSDNLDADDRDGMVGIYLVDVAEGTTQVLGSIAAGVGGEHPFVTGLSISPDGRWVAWVRRSGTYALQLHDTASGATRTVVETKYDILGGDVIVGVDLSRDARVVAFSTTAGLVAADDSGTDVYVWSRVDDSFRLASRRADGSRFGYVRWGAPPITPDGRHLAFAVQAEAGLADSISAVMVLNLDSRTHDRILGPGGSPLTISGSSLGLSADGRFVALATAQALLPIDVHPGTSDVHVFDRQTREFELASVSSGGVASDCNSDTPSMSADGLRVVFESCARNFHPGADGSREVYARDRATGQTQLLTRPLNGQLPSGHIFYGDFPSYWTEPTISDDGSQVVFASAAAGLVKGDTNRRADVFRVAMPSRETLRVGLATGEPMAAGASLGPLVPEFQPRAFASRGAGVVAFNVQADNLAPNRSAGALHWTRQTGVISDALNALASPPPRSIEIVDGISDDGRAVLVRRSLSPVDFGGVPPPPPPVPYDLYLPGASGTLIRIDIDPMLGSVHRVVHSVLSGSGRRVAFLSQRMEGTSPVGVYVFDVWTRVTRRIDLLPSGSEPARSAMPALALSRNGRWLLFATPADDLVAGDTDGSNDLFLADLDNGGLLRLLQPVSAQPLLDADDFFPFGIGVSDDGQRVVLTSVRDDLAPGGAGRQRVFLLQRSPVSLRRLDAPGPEYASSNTPSMSADGRFVAFLESGRLRVLELDVDGTTLAEPTLALPAIRAAHAALSPDGYAVSLMSQDRFPWLTDALPADVSVPYLLQLPEPVQFSDGFESP